MDVEPPSIERGAGESMQASLHEERQLLRMDPTSAQILHFMRTFGEVLELPTAVTADVLEDALLDPKAHRKFISDTHYFLLSFPEALRVTSTYKAYKRVRPWLALLQYALQGTTPEVPLFLEDYDALGPKARAALMLRACEWRLDECCEIGDMVMECLSASSSSNKLVDTLRWLPIGTDATHEFFYLPPDARVYTQRLPGRDANHERHAGAWRTLCASIEEIQGLSVILALSSCRKQNHLAQILVEQVLPPLYAAFKPSPAVGSCVKGNCDNNSARADCAAAVPEMLGCCATEGEVWGAATVMKWFGRAALYLPGIKGREIGTWVKIRGGGAANLSLGCASHSTRSQVTNQITTRNVVWLVVRNVTERLRMHASSHLVHPCRALEPDGCSVGEGDEGRKLWTWENSVGRLSEEHGKERMHADLTRGGRRVLVISWRRMREDKEDVEEASGGNMAGGAKLAFQFETEASAEECFLWMKERAAHQVSATQPPAEKNSLFGTASSLIQRAAQAAAQFLNRASHATADAVSHKQTADRATPAPIRRSSRFLTPQATLMAPAPFGEQQHSEISSDDDESVDLYDSMQLCLAPAGPTPALISPPDAASHEQTTDKATPASIRRSSHFLTPQATLMAPAPFSKQQHSEVSNDGDESGDLCDSMQLCLAPAGPTTVLASPPTTLRMEAAQPLVDSMTRKELVALHDRLFRQENISRGSKHNTDRLRCRVMDKLSELLKSDVSSGSAENEALCDSVQLWAAVEADSRALGTAHKETTGEDMPAAVNRNSDFQTPQTALLVGSVMAPASFGEQKHSEVYSDREESDDICDSMQLCLAPADHEEQVEKKESLQQSEVLVNGSSSHLLPCELITSSQPSSQAPLHMLAAAAVTSAVELHAENVPNMAAEQNEFQLPNESTTDGSKWVIISAPPPSQPALPHALLRCPPPAHALASPPPPSQPACTSTTVAMIHVDHVDDEMTVKTAAGEGDSPQQRKRKQAVVDKAGESCEKRYRTAKGVEPEMVPAPGAAPGQPLTAPHNPGEAACPVDLTASAASQAAPALEADAQEIAEPAKELEAPSALLEEPVAPTVQVAVDASLLEAAEHLEVAVDTAAKATDMAVSATAEDAADHAMAEPEMVPAPGAAPGQPLTAPHNPGEAACPVDLTASAASQAAPALEAHAQEIAEPAKELEAPSALLEEPVAPTVQVAVDASLLEAAEHLEVAVDTAAKATDMAVSATAEDAADHAMAEPAKELEAPSALLEEPVAPTVQVAVDASLMVAGAEVPPAPEETATESAATHVSEAVTETTVEEEEEEEEEAEASVDSEEACMTCGLEGELILCDGCDAASHLKCARLRKVPKGDWYCAACRQARRAASKAPATKQEPAEVVDAPPALPVPPAQEDALAPIVAVPCTAQQQATIAAAQGAVDGLLEEVGGEKGTLQVGERVMDEASPPRACALTSTQLPSHLPTHMPSTAAATAAAELLGNERTEEAGEQDFQQQSRVVVHGNSSSPPRAHVLISPQPRHQPRSAQPVPALLVDAPTDGKHDANWHETKQAVEEVLQTYQVSSPPVRCAAEDTDSEEAMSEVDLFSQDLHTYSQCLVSSQSTVVKCARHSPSPERNSEQERFRSSQPLAATPDDVDFDIFGMDM